MNTLYTSIAISFLIGLSAIIPLLLSLRPRWKARGYALGYDAAYLSQQRLLDTCHARIRALHDDLAQLKQIRDIEKRGHQTSVEAIMQDCDQRIATYSRRATAVTHQDIQQLILIAKQLERAGSAYSHQGAVEGARMAHQAQLEALNLAERIRSALDEQPQTPAAAEQEKVV